MREPEAVRGRGFDAVVGVGIVDAGRARLRPILMTALATIFALQPLALTVIGGLTTSTFLTLLVVPVGYSLLKGGRRRKKNYARQD